MASPAWPVVVWVSLTLAPTTGSVFNVARSRYSCKEFDPTKKVPAAALERVAQATAAAPSSFNMQPWRCVFVTDRGARERLAKGMLGANGKRVVDAPVTAVFASDLRSSHRVPKIQALARAAKAPETFVSKLPFFASLFASGYRVGILRWPMFLAKRLVLLLVGLARPVPKLSTPESWAFKNTMLAVQTLMLAAAEEGVQSVPMEGLDERRVRRALGIPRRYAIPCIVALGYATSEAASAPRAGRLPLAELFAANEFAKDWVPAAGS